MSRLGYFPHSGHVACPMTGCFEEWDEPPYSAAKTVEHLNTKHPSWRELAFELKDQRRSKLSGQ